MISVMADTIECALCHLKKETKTTQFSLHPPSRQAQLIAEKNPDTGDSGLRH